MRTETAHETEDHNEFGTHATLRGYLAGFVLAVILTAIPFYLVATHVLGAVATSVLILALALIQIVVHMVYFLHLNTHSEGGWNFLATIFTVVLVVIAISGSIWVMYNLDINMMPMPGNSIGTGS
jgi:cytochrome o ubiquinol oxidase operon protein cyoD